MSDEKAVHHNESSPVHDDNGPVINYYFPVRVEVVGSLPDSDVARVAGYVFDELDRELATRI
jgi:hypothetical protein